MKSEENTKNTISEKLHAMRAVTEEHIRELEEDGRAGERYTITMPDMAFLALGLICDIGWILQVVFGMLFMNADALAGAAPPGMTASIAVASDLITDADRYRLHSPSRKDS